MRRTLDAVFTGMMTLGLAATLCANPPAGPLPRKGPPSTAKRPDVPAWHDRYNMPWEVVPAELSFEESEIQAMLLRADAAAREIARPDWKVKAGKAYPYVSWNSGSNGYSRKYLAKWESGADPRHNLSLATQLYGAGAKGFELTATWAQPAIWKASVSASRFSKTTPLWFSLRLYHPEWTPEDKSGNPNSGLVVSPGGPQFQANRRTGSYEARFSVSSRGREENGEIYQPQLEDIAPYWQSPESFRTAAIDELDRLAARASELIASGEAGQLWTRGGPTGANPPLPAGPGSEISETVRIAARDEAVAQISQQKQLVEKHYKEMHHAATAAFPSLLEVLEGGSK
jgi:hypothetical protein